MKRCLFIALLISSALFVFNNCKKEYLVDVKGSVTGIVSEYYSNQSLSGVLVKVVVNDKTILKDSTDADGYYTISDIPAGYHWIIFSKTGYAKVRAKIWVYLPDEVSNTTDGKKQEYEMGITKDAMLSPVTGKVNGVVRLNEAPVNGATVIANLSGYFYGDLILDPASYTTTTDANGVYSFINLPIGDTVTLTANTQTASGSSIAIPLGIEQTIVPPYLKIKISEIALNLLNYTGMGTGVKVDTTTTNIILTFSENINENITKSNDGRVYLTVAGKEILTTCVYSGVTVTLTPAPQGQLSSGTTYSIHYDVYASATKRCNGTTDFITKEKAATLTAPVIEYSGTSGLRITAASIANGAAGPIYYDVFYKPKTGESVDFTYRKTVPSGTIPINVFFPSPDSVAMGSYYIIGKVKGLDDATVYSAMSNIATKN